MIDAIAAFEIQSLLVLLEESVETLRSVTHFYKNLKEFNEIDITNLHDLWNIMPECPF